MVTSAQCRPYRRQEDSRSAPIEKCHFAALLPLIVLLAAGVPALAADSIEELLHQNVADGHNDALRVCPKTSGGITKFSEHEPD
jgi:hypothetical protein